MGLKFLIIRIWEEPFTFSTKIPSLIKLQANSVHIDNHLSISDATSKFWAILPIQVTAPLSDLTISFTGFLIFFLVSTILGLKLRIQHKRENPALAPSTTLQLLLLTSHRSSTRQDLSGSVMTKRSEALV
jgi:hypothetical protein